MGKVGAVFVMNVWIIACDESETETKAFGE